MAWRSLLPWPPVRESPSSAWCLRAWAVTIQTPSIALCRLGSAILTMVFSVWPPNRLLWFSCQKYQVLLVSRIDCRPHDPDTNRQNASHFSAKMFLARTIVEHSPIPHSTDPCHRTWCHRLYNLGGIVVVNRIPYTCPSSAILAISWI